MKKITITINSLEDVTLLGEYLRKGTKMTDTKINKSKLARELNCDRRTIDKYLNKDRNVTVKRKESISKVTKHHDIINEIVENNNYVFAQHIYNVLKREYDADYSLSSFKRYFNNNFKNSTSNRNITSRFETEPGYQAQLDYKENQTYISESGFKFKTDILALTLANSRYTFRALIPDKSTETTIDALIRIFGKLGGVPKELVFDNPKSLVTTPKKGNEPAILNSQFEQFLKDFNIIPFPCAPYRPQTKGKVEVQMKCIDELMVYNGTYKNRLELENKLQIITEDNNSRVSQGTNKIPKLGIKFVIRTYSSPTTKKYMF